MDNETFSTQCTAVAACVQRLSLILLEARGGPSSIAKVVTEVQKLIQGFALLGTLYVAELSNKCKELERKKREVKELSLRLELSESHAHRAQNPAGIPPSDEQRHQETTIPGDGVEDVEKLCTREQDDQGDVPGSHADAFQTLNGKSEEHSKSLRGAHLDGDHNDYREEMLDVPEQIGEMGVCNEFPSRGFGQAPHATTGIKLGERSSGVNVSTAGCNEQNVDLLQSINEKEPLELNRNKRRRKFIDLESDSEERKKSSNSTSWPTARKPSEGEDLSLRLSRKSKQGTAQINVTQEQSMVETLCKTMEQYQHEFLEDLRGSYAYTMEQESPPWYLRTNVSFSYTEGIACTLFLLDFYPEMILFCSIICTCHNILVTNRMPYF